MASIHQQISIEVGADQAWWITYFLPLEIGAGLAPLIDQGTQALKSNLEAG